MKKKNFFAQNKQFTFFLILAVLILVAMRLMKKMDVQDN